MATINPTKYYSFDEVYEVLEIKRLKTEGFEKRLGSKLERAIQNAYDEGIYYNVDPKELEKDLLLVRIYQNLTDYEAGGRFTIDAVKSYHKALRKYISSDEPGSPVIEDFPGQMRGSRIISIELSYYMEVRNHYLIYRMVQKYGSEILLYSSAYNDDSWMYKPLIRKNKLLSG